MVLKEQSIYEIVPIILNEIVHSQKSFGIILISKLCEADVAILETWQLESSNFN